MVGISTYMFNGIKNERTVQTKLMIKIPENILPEIPLNRGVKQYSEILPQPIKVGIITMVESKIKIIKKRLLKNKQSFNVVEKILIYLG